jgi:hypothetical protein
MQPREIGRLTRRYVLDVIFWPRDRETGAPHFPEQAVASSLRYLYDLAVNRGLPHDRAWAWSREQAFKGAQKPDGNPV